jgi:myo-inositol 2-dehydrogenase/D-chiro-inositol 1-dehydrogenase
MGETKNPLRIGMIGCGLVMDLKHMVVLRRVAGAQVVAAADVDAEQLRAVADRHAIPARYTDPHELLARDDIDAVGICTPPAQHAALVVAALDAGKHVLVEKPLALDVDECDRMIEKARQSDRKVVVGFHMRWHRQVRHAREVLRSGRLGAMELIRGIWTNPLRSDRDLPEWRGRRETGGGGLIEIGVHVYDLFRFWTGTDVEEVFAVSHGRDWPDETASVSARMSNGVVVSALLSEVTSCDMEFEIYGREGRLRLACLRYDGIEEYARTDVPGGGKSTFRRITQSLVHLPRGLADGRHGGDYLLSYQAEWEHFVAAVRRGDAVECDLEDGRHAIQVALAAVESAKTGRPVKLAAAPRRQASEAGSDRASRATLAAYG